MQTEKINFATIPQMDNRQVRYPHVISKLDQAAIKLFLQTE